MRIAQVAPLHESVPPKAYGGTERVVSFLTEELVRQGHDVTLYASGDSRTHARLEPITPRGLRLDTSCIDPLAHHVLMLEKVMQRAREFDVIHFHCDYLHFPLARQLEVPHVTTLHGRLDIPDLAPLYREFGEMPVVSISHQQRAPLPFANWVATVHHGIPENLYRHHPGPGKYLAFLGRISPEKRLDRAIEIAAASGMELWIAAKVDKVDREYFDARIRPLLQERFVRYLGEIGEGEKDKFLGDAHALLCPIDWPEPFGLVMAEAMACGAPVIAWRRGSVPELVRDGETGYIVDSLEQAVAAVERIPAIDRARCRQVFEERFSARRMARDYLSVYQAVRAASPVRQSVA
jgi:glycosyltransferase involved in cell wall biosynthesis